MCPTKNIVGLENTNLKAGNSSFRETNIGTSVQCTLRRRQSDWWKSEDYVICNFWSKDAWTTLRRGKRGDKFGLI